MLRVYISYFQLDLIGGLQQPWTSPSIDTLSNFSATCWMYGRELHRRLRVPVGLVGVYVNTTDMWPWSPYEAVTSDCAKASVYNHTDAR